MRQSDDGWTWMQLECVTSLGFSMCPPLHEHVVPAVPLGSRDLLALATIVPENVNRVRHCQIELNNGVGETRIGEEITR